MKIEYTASAPPGPSCSAGDDPLSVLSDGPGSCDASCDASLSERREREGAWASPSPGGASFSSSRNGRRQVRKKETEADRARDQAARVLALCRDREPPRGPPPPSSPPSSKSLSSSSSPSSPSTPPLARLASDECSASARSFRSTRSHLSGASSGSRSARASGLLAGLMGATSRSGSGSGSGSGGEGGEGAAAADCADSATLSSYDTSRMSSRASGAASRSTYGRPLVSATPGHTPTKLPSLGDEEDLFDDDGDDHHDGNDNGNDHHDGNDDHDDHDDHDTQSLHTSREHLDPDDDHHDGGSDPTRLRRDNERLGLELVRIKRLLAARSRKLEAENAELRAELSSIDDEHRREADGLQNAIEALREQNGYLRGCVRDLREVNGAMGEENSRLRILGDRQRGVIRDLELEVVGAGLGSRTTRARVLGRTALSSAGGFLSGLGILGKEAAVAEAAAAAAAAAAGADSSSPSPPASAFAGSRIRDQEGGVPLQSSSLAGKRLAEDEDDDEMDGYGNRQSDSSGDEEEEDDDDDDEDDDDDARRWSNPADNYSFSPPGTPKPKSPPSYEKILNAMDQGKQFSLENLM